MVQSRKRMNRKQKGGEDNCEEICKDALDYGYTIKECCDEIKADAGKEEYKPTDLSLLSPEGREMQNVLGKGGKRRTRKAKKSNKQRKTKGGKKTAKKGKKSYKKKSTRRRH